MVSSQDGLAEDGLQRRTVLDTLLRLSASKNGDVQTSAIYALGNFSAGDPEQRRIVLETLVKLAASEDSAVQYYTITALGVLKTLAIAPKRSVALSLFRRRQPLSRRKEAYLAALRDALAD